MPAIADRIAPQVAKINGPLQGEAALPHCSRGEGLGGRGSALFSHRDANSGEGDLLLIVRQKRHTTRSKISPARSRARGGANMAKLFVDTDKYADGEGPPVVDAYNSALKALVRRR